MPKLKQNQVPSYRLHKQSGQAIVTLDGKDFLLGRHGTPESGGEYNRLIAEWMAHGRRLPQATPDQASDFTVIELVAAFWRHAQTYYRKPDGSPTSEVKNFREVLKPLKRLYGYTSAVKFGPLALQALREEMIRMGWTRKSINRQISRIKLVFKWGGSQELVPGSAYANLRTVKGLAEGRSRASESEPVRPVPDAHVDAALPFMSPPVAAMVTLQRITAMRPGEVSSMRACDIDTTGALWTYRPASHKTGHLGHDRLIFLGPQAQEVLRPFLKPDLHAYIFSPADAVEWHREQRRLARKTPLSCGNRVGTNRTQLPQRKPGSRYTVEGYAHAIYAACDRANPFSERLTGKQSAACTPEERASYVARRRAWRREHRWHAHQLRHSAATRLRKEFGLEATQVILGHRTLTVSQVYAEKNVAAAQAIMGRVG